MFVLKSTSRSWVFRISNLNHPKDDVHNYLDTVEPLNTYNSGVDTSSNTVDNYRTEGTFDTEDSYRYVSSYDNFDRNSHDHSDGHSNLDSYTSSNEASHSTEVGQNKYKTMMSGMMTDMIKSTVSTAVDTVMDSGSAKVTLWTLEFYLYCSTERIKQLLTNMSKKNQNIEILMNKNHKCSNMYKGGDDSVSNSLHTDEYSQLCLLLGLRSQVHSQRTENPTFVKNW